MVAKSLKKWSFVKDQKHDLSNISRHGANSNPEDYYYQLDKRSGIYTPAILVVDLDNVPERVVPVTWSRIR